MELIKSVPDIVVNNDFRVSTLSSFEEDEFKVILSTVEVVPQFVRGFVCDMDLHFLSFDSEKDIEDTYFSRINDLVLVYIRRTSEMASLTQFEYVFYKD